MKRTLLIIAIALCIFTALASANSSGSEIKVYSADREIHQIVELANERLTEVGITLLFVDAIEDADVTVSIVDKLSDPTAAAISHAYSGEIQILRDVQGMTADVLLHELLHCAGLDHEDDPKSMMYGKTGLGRQELKPHHIAALRKLSGITAVGRWVAQVRSWVN